MTSSITLNSVQNLSQQFAKIQQKDMEQLSSPQLGADNIGADNTPSEFTRIEDIRRSGYVSQINPQDVQNIYNQIKKEANTELEAFNLDNNVLEPFDYLKNTIDTIVDYPVEVNIERSEVNTAILYNSLGISFLDVKRIEVKMELLELAKEEVKETANAGLIRKDQAAELNKMIEGNMNELLEEKQSLLERKHITENEELLLEQLKRSQFISVK